MAVAKGTHALVIEERDRIHELCQVGGGWTFHIVDLCHRTSGCPSIWLAPGSFLKSSPSGVYSELDTLNPQYATLGLAKMNLHLFNVTPFSEQRFGT